MLQFIIDQAKDYSDKAAAIEKARIRIRALRYMQELEVMSWRPKYSDSPVSKLHSALKKLAALANLNQWRSIQYNEKRKAIFEGVDSVQNSSNYLSKNEFIYNGRRN